MYRIKRSEAMLVLTRDWQPVVQQSQEPPYWEEELEVYDRLPPRIELPARRRFNQK